MYKVAAYITAYEDKIAVEKCINAINKQSYPVESIYIVDNSSKKINYPLLDAPNIIIDRHPKNIGISGGLVISIQWAIQQNYDFLWTFDQDSQPLQDCLEQLITYYQKLTSSDCNIGIISPLPIDDVTGQILHGIVFDKYTFVDAPRREDREDFYECDITITSGSLVNIKGAKQVPLPDKNLFIDAVDWDYCLKFQQHGFRIFIVKKALLRHRFGNSTRIKIAAINREITISNYSPLRYYYIYRNQTYMQTMLAKKNHYFIVSVLLRIRTIIVAFAKFILYERNDIWLKIWACLKGTYDGFTGRLGKTW